MLLPIQLSDGVDERHVAQDAFAFCQSRDALDVRAEIGILPEGFDVLNASPLRIIDHLPAILAVESAGRNEPRHFAEERFCALFESSDQLLLMFGLDGEDADKGRYVATCANR